MIAPVIVAIVSRVTPEGVRYDLQGSLYALVSQLRRVHRCVSCRFFGGYYLQPTPGCPAPKTGPPAAWTRPHGAPRPTPCPAGSASPTSSSAPSAPLLNRRTSAAPVPPPGGRARTTPPPGNPLTPPRPLPGSAPRTPGVICVWRTSSSSSISPNSCPGSGKLHRRGQPSA